MQIAALLSVIYATAMGNDPPRSRPLLRGPWIVAHPTSMLARLVEDFGQLHHFDWLRELSGTETERLRRQSVQREYRAGEMIFTPALHPHLVYLLERGLARIYRGSASGTETTSGYIHPGEICRELAVFSSRGRKSAATAVS